MFGNNFEERLDFSLHFGHDASELEKGLSTADPTPFNSRDEADDTTRSSFSEFEESSGVFWADINLSVGKTTILENCWGNLPSGSVCAIMGPSGAGKTTLLNVIAGRTECKGCVVKVEKQRIRPTQFRKHIAFVAQDDCLMATATPREALRFSARLRLAEDKSVDLETTVNFLLEDLGLTTCADVLIGGPLIKGISGGQRKRTSVGVELVTNPKVSFPTAFLVFGRMGSF
jgi:ABC-type multidrug transport system ATPase subunit